MNMKSAAFCLPVSPACFVLDEELNESVDNVRSAVCFVLIDRLRYNLYCMSCCYLQLMSDFLVNFH